MATKIFWGLVVESGKSYTQNVGTPFAIRMACLEEPSDKKSPSSSQQQSSKNLPDDRIRVYAKYDKTDYLLCTLSNSRSIFQVPLHVKFETGSQLTLRVDGGAKKTHVHLTGFCISNSETTLSNSTSGNTSTPFSGQTQSILTSSKKEGGVEVEKANKKRVSIEDSDDIIISSLSKFNNSSTAQESDESEDEEEDDDDEENDALLSMMTSGLKKANGGIVDNKIPDFDKFLAGEDDEDDEDDDEDAETTEDDSDDDTEYAKKIASIKKELKSAKKGNNLEDMEEDEDDDSEEDDNEDSSEEDDEDGKNHVFTQKSTPDANKKNKGGSKSKLPVAADSTPNSKTAKQQQQSNPSTPSADLLKTPEQNKQSPKTPSSAGHTPMKFVSKGGLMVQELKVGSGTVAKAGKMVGVYYVGRLKSNNKVFDKTQNGPGFRFRLGKGEVIRGWDIGVEGMKVGGKRRLIIPPNLAYGKNGSPPDIPPSSTLVFDVELRNVN